jgi:hypothetical protein
MDLPNPYKLLKFYDKVRFKTTVSGVLVQPAGPRYDTQVILGVSRRFLDQIVG